MYSEYFKAMIKIQMQEPHENTVDIKDFDSKVIKFLIDYMYGGTIFINIAQFSYCQLSILQMHVVKDQCIDFV